MAGSEARPTCLNVTGGQRARAHLPVIFPPLPQAVGRGDDSLTPSPALLRGLLSLTECLHTLTLAPSPHRGSPLLSTQIKVRLALQWLAAWCLPLLVLLVSSLGCA